jgi:hypothetical protein
VTKTSISYNNNNNNNKDHRDKSMQWGSRLCEFCSELLVCNCCDMFVGVSNSSRFCVIIVHMCPLLKLGFDFFELYNRKKLCTCLS